MLSVIIPTYNRADILKKCLERLASQQGLEPGSESGPGFEVIVVDDGSRDQTQNVANEFLTEPWFRYIRQDHSQQGVARNKGAAVAQTDLLVFIGDDILAEPDFLRKHFKIHLQYPQENVVGLGYTRWDPSLPINDYMRFLESSGWQFGYGFLRPGFVERAGRYKFFYTSNLSIKKSFFEKERFDETFRGYGWEDIELGYRLMKRQGLRLFYEPQARAYHHHVIPESDLPKKMQAVGRGAQFFQKLHPEARVAPQGLKRLLIRLATSPLGLACGRLLGKPFTYKLRSWQEFFKGERREDWR